MSRGLKVSKFSRFQYLQVSGSQDLKVSRSEGFKVAEVSRLSFDNVDPVEAISLCFKQSQFDNRRGMGVKRLVIFLLLFLNGLFQQEDLKTSTDRYPSNLFCFSLWVFPRIDFGDLCMKLFNYKKMGLEIFLYLY